ncbi:MAG: ABC transporter ATP-binding protein [bacterium]
MDETADQVADQATDQAVAAAVAAIECERVSKVFAQGALNVRALDRIDLSLAPGERLAIIGASGSGKSTLLHILGGLAAPSDGAVRIGGVDINRLDAKAAGDLRNRALGFVYQFHHLLMEFTALENVAMPLLIRRVARADAHPRAAKTLERVGLRDRAAHKPSELSGGERQRAAVARAMVTRPACLLADEPTGNLDTKTAQSIHDLMIELNQSFDTCLIIATHDLTLARKMDRIIAIEDGAIVTR